MASPLYLASLVLLVVNDLWLKQAWPGVVTGKLSDVAGLFAFAVFWSTVTRRPALACSAVAAAFVFWKSAWSRPLLEGLPFSRVEDPTDLIALAVLPLAYWHCSRPSAAPARSRLLIAVVSIAAFVNTSVVQHRFSLPPDDPLSRVQFSMPLDDVVKRLGECGLHGSVSELEQPDPPQTYVHMSYESRAIAPPRTISLLARVVSREPPTLELGQVSILRQKTAGNEEAVREDVRKRLGDCFGETIHFLGNANVAK